MLDRLLRPARVPTTLCCPDGLDLIINNCRGENVVVTRPVGVSTEFACQSEPLRTGKRSEGAPYVCVHGDVSGNRSVNFLYLTQEQSNDQFVTEVIANGITSGNPQSNDVPYYYRRHDDLFIKECTKSDTKRVDALRMSRDNIESLKQQIQTFNGAIRLTQAERAAQSDRMQSKFQSKLSQQHEYLLKKAQKEKQEVIDATTRDAKTAEKREAVF